MRYTAGLLIYAMMIGAALAGENSAKIEYVIYAHCERADPVLNCRIEDPNDTKADISRTVQSQIRCILTQTPLADEMRASQSKDPSVIDDIVARPRHEQWVRMVVSLFATEMLKPGWRVPQMGAFEIDGSNPIGCHPETLNIGIDYKSDTMHALAAYVR